jgi:hypothetical protein
MKKIFVVGVECPEEIPLEKIKEKFEDCLSQLQKPKPHLVLHHFREDLSWLQNIKYPYSIYSRSLQNSKDTVHLNHDKGVEAYAYLQYIVDNYDALPEVVIFVHGHRQSWHQDGNIDDILNNLKFDKSFYNFNNCYINPMSRGEDETVVSHYFPRFKDSCLFRKSYKLWMEDTWEELFLKRIELPERFECKAGAQFYTTREKILQHPKWFYEHMLRWLMETDIDERLRVSKDKQTLDSQVSGRIMEFNWHLLFK